jgi:hypothetical protein
MHKLFKFIPSKDVTGDFQSEYHRALKLIQQNQEIYQIEFIYDRVFSLK